jgi:hypothetical protein
LEGATHQCTNFPRLNGLTHPTHVEFWRKKVLCQRNSGEANNVHKEIAITSGPRTNQHNLSVAVFGNKGHLGPRTASILVGFFETLLYLESAVIQEKKINSLWSSQVRLGAAVPASANAAYAEYSVYS